MYRSNSLGQELLNVPMGEMIHQMAFAIAEAQIKLDANSIEVAQMMGGQKAEVKNVGTDTETVEYIDTRVEFSGEKLSMLELGFSPTFYQFVDTIIEVKIAIKHSFESTYSRTTETTSKSSGGVSIGRGFLGKLLGGFSAGKSSTTTTQVNASYSQKYSYSAEGSSLLRTKLVPIPPPAILEERIRLQMELQKNKELPVNNP